MFKKPYDIFKFSILVLCFFGCQSKAPQALSGEQKNILTPKDFIHPVVLQLTHEGESSEGKFSSDGQKIIFRSKSRPKHSNSQIYILDLTTQKEKRVTYNDGDDSSPEFNKLGTKILYASTTDESKEHPDPQASPPPAAAIAPGILGKMSESELYVSEPDGSHIERLTSVSGFDGEGSFSPDGRHIVFTSGRTGDLELYEMNAYGQDHRRMTTAKGYDGQGAYSPDGKFIVLASSHDDDKIIQLFVMDRWGIKPKPLTTKAAIHWNPSWTPDGKKILFSSNRDNEKNFGVYIMNADGTCLKRLTFSESTDMFPQMSPDGKKILFTSNRSGANQIYIMDFTEPKDCSPETP